MKALTMRTLIAVTLAGAMSSVAWADNGNSENQCDSTTLKGSYIFTASGFTLVGGVAQPKTIVELIDFHGDGALTVTGGTVSIFGQVSQIAAGGSGNYIIDADCNGTLTFFGGPAPTFSLYVEANGKSGIMIQTSPGGSVFQGTITRRK